jgi:hypothetical protein
MSLQFSKMSLQGLGGPTELWNKPPGVRKCLSRLPDKLSGLQDEHSGLQGELHSSKMSFQSSKMILSMCNVNKLALKPQLKPNILQDKLRGTR